MLRRWSNRCSLRLNVFPARERLDSFMLLFIPSPAYVRSGWDCENLFFCFPFSFLLSLFASVDPWSSRFPRSNALDDCETLLSLREPWNYLHHDKTIMPLLINPNGCLNFLFRFKRPRFMMGTFGITVLTLSFSFSIFLDLGQHLLVNPLLCLLQLALFNCPKITDPFFSSVYIQFGDPSLSLAVLMKNSFIVQVQ